MEDELRNLYAGIRGQYELAAKHVHDIIDLQTKFFKIHDIGYRAKSVESFIAKCRKTGAGGNQKYIDPFRQITDLAGVRLICFLKKDVDPICETIIKVFDSGDIEDVGERIFQKGRFGYQSKHILVRLPKRSYLPSCELVDEVVCEIQVRTLLQHAWAEIEHDIQYKGDFVPDRLRKRFAALAGLLEIADGEFERIQRDSDQLIEDVKDDLVSRLTEEVLKSESSDDASDNGKVLKTSVRNLVAQGRYDEALEFYDQRIASPSASHTLFIGRAKVKFLLGDSEAALDDLSKASEVKPDDPAITNLIRVINEGNSEHTEDTGDNQIDPKKTEMVFELMLNGKGIEAFTLISELEDHGYNRAFAFINKAACCLLELDVVGCSEYLHRLKINIGTPMSVNIHLLKFVSSIIETKNFNEELNELAIISSAVPHYSLSLSPMLNFISGLKLRHRDIYNKVAKYLKSIPQLALPTR